MLQSSLGCIPQGKVMEFKWIIYTSQIIDVLYCVNFIHGFKL